MVSINDRVNGINDAARDAIDEAQAEYDKAAAAFAADPTAGIGVMRSYREAFHAKVDEIVAEAKAAHDALGPVELVDGLWVARS